MDVRIARVHYPLTTLGPGRRVGIWFQGCSLGCAGCMSRDTWSATGGHAADIAELCEVVVSARDDAGLTGVTISGGEPFEQPEALQSLCRQIRDEWPAVDILVYSGFSLTRLQRDHPGVLAAVDALISEPFVLGRPTELPWRGSSNQQLTTFTPRAQKVYGRSIPADAARLQVAVDEQGVWIAGIPRRGDLARMRTAVEGKGLVLEEVSWRA